ncbi:MAG: STAS domain-containing protein [Alphaproteobacteria bacterium]|nr:STAS domain-containing protein [Alphaproteobacteria bacterium]
MTASDDALTIALPAQLDLTAAPSLHRLLRESIDSSGDLKLDAETVGVVTSPCLQVLAAAALTQRARGKSLAVTAASPAFRRAIEELDLAQVLTLPAAAA